MRNIKDLQIALSNAQHELNVAVCSDRAKLFSDAILNNDKVCATLSKMTKTEVKVIADEFIRRFGEIITSCASERKRVRDRLDAGKRRKAAREADTECNVQTIISNA